MEYVDEDPCSDTLSGNINIRISDSSINSTSGNISLRGRDRALGVTVEAKFTVGEYDILLLSAKESNGLETWLKRNGYKIPQGASQLLQPYIRQKMKFFVAKINLGEFQKTGSQFLRPLMIAYESPKFMLPIRLGTLNSTSEQDLIRYLHKF